ncbi:MAG: RluA family pseudouridine synthase [Porphyromonadaceae bacterium]|nr:RluA family pseudouridine synthase [Porphyromonadaceae bacterium]
MCDLELNTGRASEAQKLIAPATEAGACNCDGIPAFGESGIPDSGIGNYLEEVDEEGLETPVIIDAGGTEMYEHFRFVADKGQQMLRVDKFLVDRMQKTSRNRIQQAADAGCILVNGKPVKSSYKVKSLDVVQIVMDRPRYEHEIIAEDIPLDIVYEDDTVLVVNKPAGLVVHPGHGNYTGTLVNALAWHFKDNPNYDVTDPRLGLVHRIDKDTSGLLVIAKTPEAKTDLGRQFFKKTTRREYVALVWGDFETDSGTIEGNIARNPRDRLQMAVFDDPEIGKHAVTHYSVLERFGYVTVVKCVLETGRTHQIRVHMKHIGHPLFNDARYGGDQILRGTTFAKYRQFITNCFDICPRQALHARTLGFVHPKTGHEMDFESPLPPDMTALLQKWREYKSNA